MWSPRPKAKKVVWDPRRVKSDPKLKARFAAKPKEPLLEFTQKWWSFAGGATQGQVGSAVASLRDALVHAATKAIGTWQCRKAAKPWWSSDLTKANNLKSTQEEAAQARL